MKDKRAAQALLAAHLRIARQGRSLAAAALAGAENFVEWRHYPARDLRDPVSQGRFFYHTHAVAERVAGEHGHFHVFVADPDAPGRVSHLVGISLDAHGMPFRIFATNRWVTDESWVESVRMEPQLARFRVSTHGRMAPVAAWITAFVHSYREPIRQLLAARDRLVEKRARTRCLAEVLEDRSLAVISEQQVALVDHLRSAGINP